MLNRKRGPIRTFMKRCTRPLEAMSKLFIQNELSVVQIGIGQAGANLFFSIKNSFIRRYRFIDPSKNHKGTGSSIEDERDKVWLREGQEPFRQIQSDIWVCLHQA